MKPKTIGWIYVLIQFLLIAAIIVCGFLEKKYFMRPYTYITDLLSFIFLSAGALLAAISFMNFGQYITPNPVPNENYTLKKTGLYSKIRHPIYLSVLILMLGVIFFFGAFYTLVIFAAAVGFIIVKIRFEEKQLLRKFPEYVEYKKHTYKLLPYVY